MGFLIGLLVFGLSTAVAMGLMLLMPKERAVQDRIQALSSEGGYVSREALLERSFAERVVYPVMELLAKAGGRLTPAQQRELTRLKLQQAGFRSPAVLRTMLAVKGFGLSSGLLLGWSLLAVKPQAALGVGATVVILGILGPEKWLESRIAKRKEAIVLALPDALDLIIAGTEAGLSFDAAVQRIVARSGESDRELRDELSLYLSGLRLGQSRQEALTDLGLRCGVDDLKGLVAALLQADQLGIGVGNALRAQGQSLRTRRKQRAQEAAAKAPVKMLFPLVFFIFPALFVVILGPAALQVYDALIKP